jgi:hypothetical protein
MLFRPYYLIQAFSKRANKQVTDWQPHEMEIKKRCSNLQEARKRSIQWAMSMNESNHYGHRDWVPIVRLMTDNGDYIVSDDQ